MACYRIRTKYLCVGGYLSKPNNFQVCLKPEQSLEEGEQIARDLMKKLGIQETDLISGAYADLLSKS